MDASVHDIKRFKRVFSVFIIVGIILAGLYLGNTQQQNIVTENPPTMPTGTNTITTAKQSPNTVYSNATIALAALAIKGRAPKTNYARTQFGDGWATSGGCDTRNRILARDLQATTFEPGDCLVANGHLQDPYTGKVITFVRGKLSSGAVQIDHVVALSDAWQKGAQLLTPALREQLANDPLELLAVDGPANQNKSDGDAATWLPSNKPFRCQYVARQIAVKLKYSLWVTQAEHDTIAKILMSCPTQTLPS